MQKALEKRPVGREAIEAAVARICHKLRSLGEREIASRSVGEMVMEELRHLDEVGYVRFASVYRSFQDIEAFRTEIDQLRRHRRRRETSKDQLPLLGENRATATNDDAVQAPADPMAATTGRTWRGHWNWPRAACTRRIRIRASAA